MVVKVSDASEAWLSVFNDQAERMIGCSADEINKLKSQVNLDNIEIFASLSKNENLQRIVGL